MEESADWKLAVVGCGAVAERFYLSALDRNNLDSDQIVFIDTDIEQAEKLAREIEGSAVRSDYHSVLDAVEGAIIAVPHHLHHSIASDFIKSGSHVLVEKPLAVNHEEAKDLVTTAEEAGVKIGVNNTRRLFPNMQRVKNIIANSEFGKPIRIQFEEGSDFDWPTTSGFYFTSEEARGVLMDRGPHILDLICWWLGEKPSLKRYRDDSQGGSEAFAQLEFDGQDDVSGEVKISWLSRLENVCRIECEDATIEVEPHDWKTIEIQRQNTVDKNTLRSQQDSFYDFGHVLLANFIEVMEGNSEPLIPGQEVIDSIELIQECYQNRESFDLPWLTPEEYDGTA